MKENRKKSRRGIRNIKEMRKNYEKGIKIYNLRGQLLYTGLPGFTLDYQELLRQKSQESKYKHFKRVF